VLPSERFVIPETPALPDGPLTLPELRRSLRIRSVWLQMAGSVWTVLSRRRFSAALRITRLRRRATGMPR
jgi:hypothetical protein